MRMLITLAALAALTTPAFAQPSHWHWRHHWRHGWAHRGADAGHEVMPSDHPFSHPYTRSNGS